jgi:hypothetical protein
MAGTVVVKWFKALRVGARCLNKVISPVCKALSRLKLPANQKHLEDGCDWCFSKGKESI